MIAGGSGAAGTCYSFAVDYSTDPANQARAGTDGGVFAQACILGPDGEPIAPDPDSGCATIPAPVIVGYDDEPITPNDDGSVSLPPAAAPAFGCGLEADEEGTLLVQTSGEYPPDDLAGDPMVGDYTDGGVIFCDPDGALRGLPDHTALNVAASGTELAPGLEVVATTYNSPGSPTLTVAAPSDARAFVGVAFAVLVVDLISPAQAGALVRHQIRIDGGAWTTVRELRWPEGGAGAADIRAQLEISGRASAALVPGDSWTFESRCQVEKTGVGSSPTLVSVTSATQFLGVTV